VLPDPRPLSFTPAPSVDLSSAIAESSVDGWDIVLALLVVLIGWIVSRYAARAMRSLTNRVEGITPDMATLATRVVRTFVQVLGVGVALTILGAQIQPVIAAVVLVAIVAALSLRGIAENWAAGIVLQTRRPIVAGDAVELGGYTGTVREVNGHAVVIDTFDGAVVHLPNSETLDNPIVNRSSRMARRSTAEVRVGRRTIDPTGLLQLISDRVQSVDGVITDPPVVTAVTALDEIRTTVVVMFWHTPSEAMRVTSDVILAISAALADVDPAATIVSPPPVLAPATPPPTR
jgi:small-conductance mechanosensitive channel